MWRIKPWILRLKSNWYFLVNVKVMRYFTTKCNLNTWLVLLVMRYYQHCTHVSVFLCCWLLFLSQMSYQGFWENFLWRNISPSLKNRRCVGHLSVFCLSAFSVLNAAWFQSLTMWFCQSCGVMVSLSNTLRPVYFSSFLHRMPLSVSM